MSLLFYTSLLGSKVNSIGTRVDCTVCRGATTRPVNRVQAVRRSRSACARKRYIPPVSVAERLHFTLSERVLSRMMTGNKVQSLRDWIGWAILFPRTVDDSATPHRILYEVKRPYCRSATNRRTHPPHFPNKVGTRFNAVHLRGFH